MLSRIVIKMSNTNLLFPSYQRMCQPYACRFVAYNTVESTDTRDDVCVPPGYQPKRPNPGGLKFSVYDYPYHTADGQVLNHPGMGWYRYEHTGQYY